MTGPAPEQSDRARGRRLPTSWVVAAFVVLVLVVATILIVTRFDGEDDVPEQTDVGAPPTGGPRGPIHG